MSERAIPNEQFLREWQGGRITEALTEIEAGLVEQKVRAIEAGVADVLRERKLVAEQSGDNWHDGAFRATDEASLRLREQYAAMREARHWPVVSLPDAGSKLASLGSRALIRLGTAEFHCDIVGISMLHDDDGDVEIATLKSDMGKGLVGMESGTERTLRINGRDKVVGLVSVEPSPSLFSDTVTHEA